MSIPPTRNGGEGHQWIPPDLGWDEDNHPEVYACSLHTRHHPNCNHRCGPRTEIDSELQVQLINEGRAYARAGMSFLGIPAAYQNQIPIPGIAVDLVDMMMWLQSILQTLAERLDIDEFEFQELFRAKKLEFLRNIREANEQQVKEAQLRQQMAVAKKPLLGPDGQPFH